MGELRTLGDVRRYACERLSDGSEDVVDLSRMTLDVLAARRPGQNDQTLLSASPELQSALGWLAESINRAAVTEARSPRQRLGRDLERLARSFGSEDERRRNSLGYYQAMREIILQTSQGERLVNCFERSGDPAIVGHNVLFDDTRKTVGAEGGTFQMEMKVARRDETRKPSHFELSLTVDLRTDPLAAIAMVAHEYQHACNAPANCQALRDCSDVFNCPEVRRRDILDEVRAHHLEAQVFGELAQSHPALMCQQNVSLGEGGAPVRLADFHARNSELYERGELLEDLLPRYAEQGFWARSLVRDPQSGSIRPELRQLFEAAQVPLR
jgi:hypothetical protein